MKEYYIIKLGQKQFCLNKIQLIFFSLGNYYYTNKMRYKLPLNYTILAKIKCKTTPNFRY